MCRCGGLSAVACGNGAGGGVCAALAAAHHVQVHGHDRPGRSGRRLYLRVAPELHLVVDEAEGFLVPGSLRLQPGRVVCRRACLGADSRQLLLLFGIGRAGQCNPELVRQPLALPVQSHVVAHQRGAHLLDAVSGGVLLCVVSGGDLRQIAFVIALRKAESCPATAVPSAKAGPADTPAMSRASTAVGPQCRVRIVAFSVLHRHRGADPQCRGLGRAHESAPRRSWLPRARRGEFVSIANGGISPLGSDAGWFLVQTNHSWVGAGNRAHTVIADQHAATEVLVSSGWSWTVEGACGTALNGARGTAVMTGGVVGDRRRVRR
jgi:hypothetical protein